MLPVLAGVTTALPEPAAPPVIAGVVLDDFCLPLVEAGLLPVSEAVLTVPHPATVRSQIWLTKQGE